MALRRAAFALTVALVTVAGCTRSGTKAGGAEPVTLRIAALEQQSAPYAKTLEEFARQAGAASHGRVRVQIVWNAATATFGEYGPRAEQQVAGLVRDGRTELGFIPTRAWDELGVTSFQALQAPFLIDSQPLLTKVVQSDMPARMLAGLEPAGVVGLALLPEDLRHPIGFNRPFLSISDFNGAKVRTLQSDVAYQTLRALGAEPVSPSGTDFGGGAASGQIAGAESALEWGFDLPDLGTFTSNITFYPKVESLVANKAAFARLGQQDQRALREAASGAQRYAIAHMKSEADAATEYCGMHGSVVTARTEDVAALTQATAPVYATLERDPQTKTFIAQIRTLRAGVADPAQSGAQPCGVPESRKSSTPGTPAQQAAFPEGVYRNDNPELQTLTIKNGFWKHEFPAGSCNGSYSVRDGWLTLTLNTAMCDDPADYRVLYARWELKDGVLRFLDAEGDLGALKAFTSAPWQKIG